MLRSLVGSEMCIRDRHRSNRLPHGIRTNSGTQDKSAEIHSTHQAHYIKLQRSRCLELPLVFCLVRHNPHARGEAQRDVYHCGHSRIDLASFSCSGTANTTISAIIEPGDLYLVNNSIDVRLRKIAGLGLQSLHGDLGEKTDTHIESTAASMVPTAHVNAGNWDDFRVGRLAADHARKWLVSRAVGRALAFFPIVVWATWWTPVAKVRKSCCCASQSCMVVPSSAPDVPFSGGFGAAFSSVPRPYLLRRRCLGCLLYTSPSPRDS